MNFQINIKNIKINSISTLGSLNVGKVILADNKASTMQLPKPYYEESDVDQQDIKELVPEPLYPIPGLSPED